jgi:hypothetical protein
MASSDGPDKGRKRRKKLTTEETQVLLNEWALGIGGDGSENEGAGEEAGNRTGLLLTLGSRGHGMLLCVIIYVRTRLEAQAVPSL